MPGATRRSKRKADEAEVAAESKEEDSKPAIIKKPRKDIAAAAAAKAAADEEHEKPEATAEKEREEAATDEKDKEEPSEKEATEKEQNEEVVEDKPVAKAPGRKGRLPAKKAPVIEDEPDDGAPIPEEDPTSWNQHLVELLLYKYHYKSLNVSASNNAPLRNWVDIQRKVYRRHRNDPSSITDRQREQLNALEAIEFPFTLKGELHWDRFYEKLREFRDKHGHSLVPRLCEFPGLGDWVVDQRRHYKLRTQGKASGLDDERVRKLEELGMVWNVRNRPEWNSRFDELLAYKEKHGDTKVPQHYKGIPGLGKWVAKQREQYRLLKQGKHSFLTPDRLEKLKNVGFVFSVRSMTKEEEGDANDMPADDEEQKEKANTGTSEVKKEEETGNREATEKEAVPAKEEETENQEAAEKEGMPAKEQTEKEEETEKVEI